MNRGSPAATARSRQGPAFLAAYAVLWIASDFGSQYYAAGSGLSLWDIRAALDVTLFIRFGWGWWPLPVLLTALRLFAAPAGFEAPAALNLALSVPYELIYAFAVAAVTRAGVRFPLMSLRNVFIFLGALVIAAPVLSNAMLVGAAALAAVHHVDVFAQALKGAVADAVSIIVVVPFLATVLQWRRPLYDEEPAERRGFDRRLALELTVLAIVVVIEYLWTRPSGTPFVEFSVIPLAWIAIRDGTRGASIAILVCDAAATIMHIVLRIPVPSQIEFNGYLIANALVALLVGVISSERTAFAERVRRAAYYDPVTGLATALHFDEWLAGGNGHTMVVLLADVSDIRLLKETIGSQSSDELLRLFGQRLAAIAPPHSIVARTGYDEFALAVAETENPQPLVEAVHEVTQAPFVVAGANLYVELTVGGAGVSAFETPTEALRRAGASLRAAKQTVQRSHVLHAGERVDETALPITDLYRSVERNEFISFFQPIYRFDRERGVWRMAGAEALMRWLHPQQGVLMPSEFLGVLNRFSLGANVGWKLLEENLRNALLWNQITPGLRVWVNLSSRQVLDPHAAKAVESALAHAGAAPEMLVVEITEQLVSGYDREVAEFARQMRKLGASVAIDDFGTGSSSLSRLREVPAQILKIDRSFVIQSAFDEKARAVVRAVSRLATELGIETLAEGVETPAQIEAMLEAGCSWGQGYAFGHPMPADAFEDELRKTA